MPSLSISPTTVEPNGSITFTVSGFIEGGDYIILDYLSGPPVAIPYPFPAFQFPAANGSYGTNAPSVEGTYVVRARQGTLLSNEATFTVTAAAPPPPPEANGKILGIVVQDYATDAVFFYSDGAWDRQPIVTPGHNLYLGATAVNQGDAGNLTLIIKDDTGAVLASETEYVATGGGLAANVHRTNMPNRSYSIEIKVTP